MEPNDVNEIAVDIRNVTSNAIGPLERYIAFDWGNVRKHEERLRLQSEGVATYLLAWRGELPVGHVLIKWRGTADEPMSSHLTNCPDLEDLIVSPECRSMGVGTALLEHAEELALQNGYSQIGLGVEVENDRARSLYELLRYVDSDLGAYVTSGSYLDREGVERPWQETCNYLVKQLD